MHTATKESPIAFQENCHLVLASLPLTVPSPTTGRGLLWEVRAADLYWLVCSLAASQSNQEPWAASRSRSPNTRQTKRALCLGEEQCILPGARRSAAADGWWPGEAESARTGSRSERDSMKQGRMEPARGSETLGQWQIFIPGVNIVYSSIQARAKETDAC